LVSELRFGRSMASSVTDAGNLQQGGKKGKNKNKDLSVLIDDKLVEINHSMLDLTGRVDDMEKRIEELESTGDFEEFCAEMQEAVKSLASNVDEEVRALWDRELQACKAEVVACKSKIEAYKARVEALETQLKACMAAVANTSNGGLGKLSTTPKVNALQTPTYSGVKNTREMENFFWKFEAYFGAVGIVDEAQKVKHASFSLKDIALVWWHRRCDDVNRGSTPITTWDEFKRELKE